MTEDEQEALSVKYLLMPSVIRLSSGNFAIYFHDKPPIITDANTLPSWMPYAEDLIAEEQAQERTRRQPERKLTSINLADLGL